MSAQALTLPFHRFRRAVAGAAAAADRLLAAPRAWMVILALIAVVALLRGLPGVGGSWFRSGSDMQVVLTAARSATAGDVLGWVTGPWIGAALFEYYRPVTSLAWYGQYWLFGENGTPWQVLSLALHVGAVLILALLVRRLFGSRVAAVAAALAWTLRDRLPDAVEWVPAQTDFLAAFFALAALLCLQRYLDSLACPAPPRPSRRRSAPLIAAAALGLLAMGSKEVALILPLLGGLLVLRAPLTLRAKLFLVAGCVVVLALFVAVRMAALGGLGYLPGVSTRPGAQVDPVHVPVSYRVSAAARGVLGRLVPGPWSPPYYVSPAAILVLFAGGWLALAARGWLLRTLILAATCVATVLLAGLDLLASPPMQSALLQGAVWLGGFALLVRRRLPALLFVLAWGLVTQLPLYRIVYNRAGNVTYLPETYWALIWGLLAAELVRQALHAGEREPEGDADVPPECPAPEPAAASAEAPAAVR